MIKIVAESIKSRNKTHFVVRVVEDDTVIVEQTAATVNKRDELIWDFAEQFNTTDIQIIGTISVDKTKQTEDAPKGKAKFKYSEIPVIPVVEMSDASDYFDDHEDIVFNRVLVAVREGIESGRNVIRLFELNGTGVYLTSEKADWKSGLDNAEKYFLTTEEYEKCAVCQELKNKL